MVSDKVINYQSDRLRKVMKYRVKAIIIYVQLSAYMSDALTSVCTYGGLSKHGTAFW